MLTAILFFILLVLIYIVSIRFVLLRIECNIEFYGKQIMTLIRWKEKIDKERDKK